MTIGSSIYKESKHHPILKFNCHHKKSVIKFRPPIFSSLSSDWLSPARLIAPKFIFSDYKLILHLLSRQERSWRYTYAYRGDFLQNFFHYKRYLTKWVFLLESQIVWQGCEKSCFDQKSKLSSLDHVRVAFGYWNRFNLNRLQICQIAGGFRHLPGWKLPPAQV